jgi:hypothetical protein
MIFPPFVLYLKIQLVVILAPITRVSSLELATGRAALGCHLIGRLVHLYSYLPYFPPCTDADTLASENELGRNGLASPEPLVCPVLDEDTFVTSEYHFFKSKPKTLNKRLKLPR